MARARKGGAFPHSGAAEPRELLRTFADLDSLGTMWPTATQPWKIERWNDFLSPGRGGISVTDRAGS
jgi:hypothetical protein